MPSQIARAVGQSERHGGCGEVGCAALFQEAGIPLEGATFQSVRIGVPAAVTPSRSSFTELVMAISEDLQNALHSLRAVRAQRPKDSEDKEQFAEWREEVAKDRTLVTSLP